MSVSEQSTPRSKEIAAAQETVSRQGWLSFVPEVFRLDVLTKCHLRHFEAGQSVYLVGDPPGGLYGLVSGSLGISIAPGERGPYFAHLAQPGEWFGEAAAITGQPRRVGLTATRPTQLLHLPLPAVLDMAARNGEVWRYIALLTTAHLDVAIGACDDLMIRDHVKRCIAMLLRLAGCRGRTPPGTEPRIVDLSQEDLAAIANVARTTIGSVLHRLEQEGRIEQSYRRIRILRPDSLRAMLGS